MPDSPSPALLAPCGMNCLVCYRRCAHKKPCAGCLDGDVNKPEHCRRCALRACAGRRGHTHCFACAEFPCAPIRRLDGNYRRRYGVSLIENGKFASARGISALMERDRAAYRCPVCGGVISLHDAACGECGRPAARDAEP